MGRLGFEPRTNRLKAECSTAELATLVKAEVFLKHGYLRYHTLIRLGDAYKKSSDFPGRAV